MRLRELWDRGEPTVGGWCVMPGSFSAELMGRAGFDWVCLDTQHGLIGYDALVPMLQALAITSTPGFVRVASNDPAEAMKALDAGAQGVIAPLVSSADEARRLVAACRYPPEGHRSWGPVRAALGVQEFTPASANREVVCVVMVETREGLDRLDEILQVPGVDAVFVGPSDLAVSHGIPPSADPTDPAHRELIENVLRACLRHRVVPGIYCGSAETAEGWREAGFRMLSVANDAAFLTRGAAAAVAKLRRRREEELA